MPPPYRQSDALDSPLLSPQNNFRFLLTECDYYCNPHIDYSCKRKEQEMKKTPRISETEWEVMKVVWTGAPCTASQVIERLTRADPTWHPKTVKAFLNRLVTKRVLGFRKEGRAYLYRPLVRESECVAAASESLLERVFGGSLKPMLAHFVERQKLTPQEVEELKELLEKGEPGRREQQRHK